MLGADNRFRGIAARRTALLVVIVMIAVSCQATGQVTLVDDPGSTFETADDFDAGSALDADMPDGEAQDGEIRREPALPEQPLNRESPLDSIPTPTPTPDANPFADPVNGGGVDLRLTRNDVDCDEEELNAYPNTQFVVAHVVVDGNLGGSCFGDPDERLIKAWNVLANITPPGQLHDLGLFGGYESLEQGETTLAFVNTMDYEGSLYQMSINLDEAEADPEELLLTMAHEFSHVFTSLPSQIDRFLLPEECETWDNGEGCFLNDSLMWEWVELFWDDGLIQQIDPYGQPSSAEGEARCNRNPSFLGSYAASSPQEDFAEAFSAFVYRLDVRTEALQEKMEWFARQPGLVDFRNRAVEAGYGPLTNYFERCG